MAFNFIMLSVFLKKHQCLFVFLSKKYMMNKILILFACSFINTVLFAQLTIKVKVESVAVQNSLDCDGLTEGDSDFLFEFKTTDNSAAALTNNTPTVGSIGNCNFISMPTANGPYSLTPSFPSTAIFSPTNGVFFNHSYNCHQNIPTASLQISHDFPAALDE